MTAKKSVNPVSGNFDLCFRGINLTGALNALAALRSGLKVAIIIDEPIRWSFDPEMVILTPLELSKVFQSISSIKYFEKISSLFPSLVYPQRILFVSEKRKFRSKTASLIDIFLQRDREIASLPINFARFPSFQIMQKNFQNGLLVQEYQFDRNKAIIEILLLCKKLGASIVTDQSMINDKIDEKCVFTCLPKHNKNQELYIEDFRFSFPNSIRIVTRDFEITSQILESFTSLHFSLKRNILSDDFIKHVLSILKSIGIESAEKYETKLKSIYDTILQNSFQNKNEKQQLSDHDISVLNLKSMKDSISISKLIGKVIGYRNMVKKLKYNRFEGKGFRRIQTECDEKFDLAKQTGIEYQKFCYYFYRYYGSIDDFIESAYQKINSFRTEPKYLWEAVEKEFKDKIEAELFC